MEVVSHGRSRFANVDIKGLGKDLLEKAFNFNLKTFEQANELGVDFIQYNADENINEVVVDIIWTKLYKKDINEFIERYLNLYEVLKPLKIVLLNYEFSQTDFQEELKKTLIEKTSGGRIDFIFLDVYWITDTLKKYPGIEERWFINKAKDTPVTIDLYKIIPPGVNFYVVGSMLDNEDQTNRFIEENIWANNEEKYIEGVKNIKPGDVLVLNSPFTEKRSAVFIVTSIGVVQKNGYDGLMLQVDWRIRPKYTDIGESLAKYRNAFNSIDKKDFIEIIENLELPESEINSLFTGGFEEDKYISNTLQFAYLDNDNPKIAKDLLGFDKDIRAFASLVALKKLNPPIAISLFGNWGSGKSFFMHKLSKNVELLSVNQGYNSLSQEKTTSGNDDENPYCEGIAQITFNAWAYLDANLWAGLVSAIFQKLDEYINDYSQSSRYTKKIKREISEELNLFQEQKRELKEKKTKFKSDYINLRRKLKKKKLILRRTHFESKNKNLEILLKEVRNGVKFSEADVKLLQEWGISKDDIENLSPGNLLELLRTLKSSLKNFFKLTKVQILMFSSVLLLVMGAYILPDESWNSLHQKLLEFVGFIAAPASAVIYKIKDTLNKYAPIVKKIVEKNEELERKTEEAKTKHAHDLLVLQLNISEKEREIESIKNEIDVLDKKIDKVNYDIEYNLAHESLRKFITDRIISHEYDKHLGIISIIRKDLETLSDLFLQNRVASQVSEKPKKKEVELEKKYAKINEKLFPRLERIILYIDDLDRCPDDKVLEVLQAVHLLMAFPLFIVVVGVDKRCVENALRYKNLLQYSNVTGLNSPKELKETFNINVIEPKEYLEKIFQIPFMLQKPGNDDIINLVDNLLREQVKTEDEIFANGGVSADYLNQEIPNQELINPEKNSDSAIDESTKNVGLNLKPDLGLKIKSSQEPLKPADLKFSSKEFRYIKQIACLVGNNPRTVKRFINIYRIIRTHENLSYSSFQKNESFLCVMFILALLVADYHKYESLFEMLENSGDEKVLADILQELDFKELKDEIEKNDVVKHLLQNNSGSFKTYIPFIRRFSF